jgi:hypothetical protein
MEKNENLLDKNENFFVTIIIIIVLLTLHYIYTMYTLRVERVTVKSKYILNDRLYKLTFSSLDGKVYVAGNNLWFGHFKSVELWDSIREGEKYDLVVYGSRVPFLDIFPVVIKTAIVR